MKRTQWLWLLAGIACGAYADQVSWHQNALIDLYAVQPEHLDGGGEVIGFYQLIASQRLAESFYWQASAFANSNGSVSAIAQDLQGASNIESRASARLAEAYLGWEAGPWRVELGRRDENSVFAAVGTATQFIQSSYGYSPTLESLVSYPEGSWLVNARYQLSKAVNATLGFSHDHENAWLAQLRWHPFRGADWTVGGREGQPYAIIEQHWQGYSGQWRVFAQYGHNNTPTRFRRHRSIGVTWQRHDHEFGLATSWVNTVAEQVDERAYEVYWRAKITDWLALQPDIQWLDQRRKSLQRGQDSTILTLRLAMNW